MFCPGLLIAASPHLTQSLLAPVARVFPQRREAVALAAVLITGAALLAALAPQRFGLHPFVLMIDASRVPFAIGFGLILAAAIHARPVRSTAAIRLGLVSYGIYLLHPVVIAFLVRYWVPLREGLGPYLVHVAVVAGLTIPLAMLSWRFFEEPLVRWARRFGRRPALDRAGQDGVMGDAVAPRDHLARGAAQESPR